MSRAEQIERFLGEVSTLLAAALDCPGAPRHGVSAQRTVQPQLFPEVPDALLVAMARDTEHLAAIRQLAPKSVIVVPMIARDRALGAMMLVTSESGRTYGPEDLRDDVLAFVSHDLKAPLSSIKLSRCSRSWRPTAPRAAIARAAWPVWTRSPTRWRA
jgi:hypothetical protein